ncbi:response regulator receiver modulated diguanylate cyclase/phosphodiesterase with PAS/PAC sensor(s) [Sphingobium chlorophenolicum L-1]|uniref:Response regulator receiver modulated diguanylate cyclase/phosphodiesterase with PAS/PAC sensor(S) n=1 Tax=Sphingobium chlorophenolicum L-1 TaxID=690566 RepID=F6EZA8_SPHCR|nr:EAL domain-containing protein [Sphingobium chlorophenolicum]AEG50201.1 response regulator receiver modulated diguanylate cyclase/phosphodiesterase with PAS/PAC sensor(s) [Sphingobium chlorophenolicum L-1]
MMNGALATESVERTVLIVDDNPANLGVIVDHLEDAGLHVSVAQGGEEALKRAQFIQPDLILLDVMMPGIDGFETCRRLKANEATREIPVIFMTALDDIHDKVAAFAAGGVDYVSKPFQVEELLARVITHLELRSARQRLIESELRYRRLFETASDGIVLLDRESGRITDVNPALSEMINLSPSQLLGRTFGETEPFSNNPSCKRVLDELRHRDHVWFEDWILETGRGTSVNVEVNGSVYKAATTTVIQCNLRDITDRKEAEARIRYMALHDALTGLPNRTLFEDRLDNAIAQARRHHGQVAVLMLDLDRFKNINDSLGHHVGDELLEQVAARLRACLRESDTAARLGGDEFAIILPEIASIEDAEIVAKRILEVLQEPFHVEQHELNIGGSIGIARYPDDGTDHGTLLRAADAAMYDAKAQGRGMYRFFSPELNEAAQLRHMLVNDVRHARQRGEFLLYYQPQLSLASHQISGVEALLRWDHPKHGIISPALFIPLLEELGLMSDVGEWVLRTACRQNAEWQAQGLPPMRTAVNLSAQQFYRGNIVKTVARVLEESGLEPKWLELELTETLTLDESETTIEIMNGLKNLGVGLTLDDFGTGWSSLSYLRRFPLDRIKIDRSFMRDVTTHENAAAVVHSILNLAQSLGLTCIAEGVETAEQLQYLKQQLCSEMQGFFFSHPLPAAEMPTLLRAATLAGLSSAESDGTVAPPGAATLAKSAMGK